MISKFASLKELNRIKEIVKTLEKRIEEKKEEDKIEFRAKDINALIDDLNLFVENVKELNEKLDESKDVKEKKDDSEDKSDKEDSDKDESDKDKSDADKEVVADADKKVDETKDKSDEGKEKSDEGAVDEKDDKSDNDKEISEDDKVANSEATAKYKSLCGEYSNSLKEAQILLKVKDEVIAKLSTEKAELVDHLSKFEQAKVLKEKDEYDSSLKTAVESYAKFNKLTVSDTKVLDQKQKWITSKMSKVALVEIGEAYNVQVISKLNKEQKVETISSANINNIEESKEFSKLSADEQLDIIAERVAKAANFRE